MCANEDRVLRKRVDDYKRTRFDLVGSPWQLHRNRCGRSRLPLSHSFGIQSKAIFTSVPLSKIWSNIMRIGMSKECDVSGDDANYMGVYGDWISDQREWMDIFRLATHVLCSTGDSIDSVKRRNRILDWTMVTARVPPQPNLDGIVFLSLSESPHAQEVRLALSSHMSLILTTYESS